MIAQVTSTNRDAPMFVNKASCCARLTRSSYAGTNSGRVTTSTL
jgi:hypothetical protein